MRFFLASATLGFGSVILAARHLPAGVIVLHESLTPVLIVLLALAVRSEAVSARKLVGVALGMSGVLLVLWPVVIGPGGSPAHGLLFALLVPIAYGADAIYVATRWPDDLSCVQVVAGEMIAAALLSLPLFLMSGEPLWFAAASAAGRSALLIFVLVSFVEIYLYFICFGTRRCLHLGRQLHRSLRRHPLGHRAVPGGRPDPAGACGTCGPGE